jgi:hypothetical protein
MLFEKSLTGNIGVLVPVLEDYANPKGLLFIPNLGDGSTQHSGIGEQFDHFWREGFLLSKQIELQLLFGRKVSR